MPAQKKSVKLVERFPGLLSSEITRRIDQLVIAETKARKDAAKTATRVTRQSFKYKRPKNVPPRPGRAQNQHMTQALKWVVDTDPARNLVEFDITAANRTNPYWIIQEIGTEPGSSRATIRRAGVSNPTGRPAAGASYVVQIRSQRGRLIPGSLVWAKNGRYQSPVPGGSGAQLYLRSTISDAPNAPKGPSTAMAIQREIVGQHMVRKGAKQGFREYRQSVYAAARTAFQR